MEDKISFSYVKTGAQNKQVVKDGEYYLVNLGGFNCYNRSGAFYLADGVKDLVMNKSGAFHRRMSEGYLKGEAGHPAYVPGMSTLEFYERNLQIDLARVSHIIRDVEFHDTKTPSGRGGNVIQVKGWVRPAGGSLGDALRADLEDPETNVAFSIRCFTKDENIGGVTIKKVLQIVTWDWVTEPGIKTANKFDTILGTESLSIPSVTLEEFKSLGNRPGLSTESSAELLRDTINRYNQTRLVNNVNILNKW